MTGKLQFSLRYLLLETFWIAVLLALARFIWLHWDGGFFPDEYGPLVLLSYGIFPFVLSITIGGLFGQMRVGAIAGIVVFALMLAFSYVVGRAVPVGPLG